MLLDLLASPPTALFRSFGLLIAAVGISPSRPAMLLTGLVVRHRGRVSAASFARALPQRCPAHP
jgi:hypothetical protein